MNVKHKVKISYGTFHKWRKDMEAEKPYPENWRIRREQYAARQKELISGKRRK